MADCRFLCGFSGVSNYNLHFKYSTKDNFTNPLVEKPLGNGTTEAHVIFPLTDPMPPETDFFYQVLAFDEDQQVLILGNFTTGNYSDGKHSYTQKLKYTICMSYYISIGSLCRVANHYWGLSFCHVNVKKCIGTTNEMSIYLPSA